MFRPYRKALRLRQALSVAAIIALALTATLLTATLVRPAAAADSYLDIHVQNNLDRRVYIECRVKPRAFSTSMGMTVEPGHNIKMTFQPIRLGPEVATMHCGAFDYAGGSKGAPIFPGAGSGAAAASAARLRSAARRLCSRFFCDLLGGVVLPRAGCAASAASVWMCVGASTSEAMAKIQQQGLRAP